MKCEIIRDLLPSYLDHLTSEDSNLEIENHLRTCESCRSYFDEMGGRNPALTPQMSGEEEKREIDVLKSFRRHLRRGIFTACAIVSAMVILVCLLTFQSVSIPYEKTQPEALVTEIGISIEEEEELFRGIQISVLTGNITYSYLPFAVQTLTVDGEEQTIVLVTHYTRIINYLGNRDSFSESDNTLLISIWEEGLQKEGASVSEISAVYYLDSGFRAAKNADEECLKKILKKYGHLIWSAQE